MTNHELRSLIKEYISNFLNEERSPIDMDVIEVDMPIEELVKYSNEFSTQYGIAQKKASASKE